MDSRSSGEDLVNKYSKKRSGGTRYLLLIGGKKSPNYYHCICCAVRTLNSPWNFLENDHHKSIPQHIYTYSDIRQNQPMFWITFDQVVDRKDSRLLLLSMTCVQPGNECTPSTHMSFSILSSCRILFCLHRRSICVIRVCLSLVLLQSQFGSHL